jgi:hypothetical protein
MQKPPFKWRCTGLAALSLFHFGPATFRFVTPSEERVRQERLEVHRANDPAVAKELDLFANVIQGVGVDVNGYKTNPNWVQIGLGMVWH